jgi:3-deoxy-7-phosphoheptulonate synthase
MPVGFKNGTDGGIEVAINAMQAAASPHSFIGMDAAGRVSVVRTAGNPDAHVVLRGGSAGPNFSDSAVQAVASKLRAAKQNPRVLIDCSHGNSQKDYNRQPLVAEAIAEQLECGSADVLGVMLESHLVAGRQDLVAGQQLRYGQSITDACIDFSTTEQVLERLAQAARSRVERAA